VKILSRLFRNAPPPPEPVATEAAAPAEPAPPPPPAVDPAEQERLLQSIEAGELAPAELARVAVEGPTTRVRQAAANAIDDPQLWQELLPRLRGRDKAAYKLIRQRHDALLAQQRADAAARDEAEALCAALEKHATRPHDPLYAPTLATLAERRQALPPSINATLHERASQAFARCEAVIAAEAERQAQRLAEQQRLAQEKLERERLEREQAASEAAAAEVAAAAAAAATPADAEPEVGADAGESADTADATDSTDATHTADPTAAARREIASLIRLSGAALQRGDTRKAARFRQALETTLPAAGELPPHLLRNLEQLDLRLNELRQWKDYVAAPKRLELIEEMEALIGVDQPPAELAEHIRALRQEWRTINKGLAVEASAESERFEQAFQKAFQPCQVWFAEQAALRRTNLEARREVLARLQAFESAQPADDGSAAPDYAQIQRVLRLAPPEYRGHAPVDRDAARALDADFYGALDRLRARVTTWHARNLADKQALIERARSLASAADLPRAIDDVKQLQARWKDTGPVPHPQSQALWDEFRALCNTVFDRRQQQVTQLQATWAEAKAKAEAVCAAVEQATATGPTDRNSGEAQLRAWQDEFDAAGELPRADDRALRERFRRSMAAYAALIDGLGRRDAEAAEANALTAARHVRAAQRAVIEAADEAQRTALREAAESFIAGVPRWPHKSLAQTLRQALARADSADFAAASDATREQALRELCIRAEVLGGVATPTEDTARRREIELGLLRQGLGQARRMDERDWDAMRTEWFGLPAAPPAMHDALEQRFLQCLRQRSR
jgi:hypothetical protein